MRDTSPRRWQRWRITHATPDTVPPANRLEGLRLPAPVAAGHDEEPGPDGIRHALVARVRAEIAAGTYEGPTYGQALGQGATAPGWYGGSYTLKIPSAASAFQVQSIAVPVPARKKRR